MKHISRGCEHVYSLRPRPAGRDDANANTPFGGVPIRVVPLGETYQSSRRGERRAPPPMRRLPKSSLRPLVPVARRWRGRGPGHTTRWLATRPSSRLRSGSRDSTSRMPRTFTFFSSAMTHGYHAAQRVAERHPLLRGPPSWPSARASQPPGGAVVLERPAGIAEGARIFPRPCTLPHGIPSSPMVEIHFSDGSSQPLCRRVAGEGWLRAVDQREVTCSGCGLLLRDRERRRDLLTRDDESTAG
jgi:hypothetical protein